MEPSNFKRKTIASIFWNMDWSLSTLKVNPPPTKMNIELLKTKLKIIKLDYGKKKTCKFKNKIKMLLLSTKNTKFYVQKS